jgi:hypothetical protein
LWLARARKNRQLGVFLQVEPHRTEPEVVRNALLFTIAILLALLKWQVYQQGSTLEIIQNDLDDIGAYLEDLQQQSEDDTSGAGSSDGVVRGSDRPGGIWIQPQQDQGQSSRA